MSDSRMQPHPPTEQQNSSQAPAPVNLPPIHHFPPQQPAMQSQPPSYTAPMSSNGAPPPQHPQPYPPPQYQYQNGVPPAMQAGVAGNGQNGLMRIPLPHAQLDSRHMSGGRHKKEIKRRTKTGCMTCRKRRIKVSEYISKWCSAALRCYAMRGGRVCGKKRANGLNQARPCSLHTSTRATPATVFPPGTTADHHTV